METRKVNVMGKEVQIPKGMTFGELAKEFEGEVFGKILVAKQGNSLRELICPIRSEERRVGKECVSTCVCGGGGGGV